MIWPHPLLKERWDTTHYAAEGNSQPWVQLLLYSLIRAIGVKEVIEFGCFRGITTAWLALAVEANGGGLVSAIERDVKDMEKTVQWVHRFFDAIPNTNITGHQITTLDFIDKHPDIVKSAGLIFLDDDKADIIHKVAKLRGVGCTALLTVHDVDGTYSNTPPLKELWPMIGGFTVPATKIHENGALGLLQL